MMAQALCTNFLVAIVWLCGLLVALLRWHRHPQVSTCTAISLVSMLTATGGQAGLLLAVRLDQAWAIYLFYAVDSMLRTIGWVGILAAIFGWRTTTVGAPDSQWLQFSIRNLLMLTLLVGVLCGAIRGLVALLGLNAESLQGFVLIIPLLLILPIGAHIAWLRRRVHPSVSRCVFAAIGLEIASWLLNLVAIATFMHRPGRTMEVLSILSLLWSLMSAVKWLLLIYAALGWRQEPIRRHADDAVGQMPANSV
jgi:hypothetical protein